MRGPKRLGSTAAPAQVLLALPRNAAELDEAVKRSKSIVTRRAALASAASLVPVPGFDIAVDIAAVMKLIPAINAEFGLTPAQIDKLSPGKRLMVYKSIVAVGSLMIGTLVTKTLLISGEGGTVAMPDGQRGAMLRAYDKKTGAEVGAVQMSGAQTGSPMTYMLGGKQYIVVASSSSIRPGELMAYRLP